VDELRAADRPVVEFRAVDLVPVDLVPVDLVPVAFLALDVRAAGFLAARALVVVFVGTDLSPRSDQLWRDLFHGWQRSNPTR
jgi:hypothetical protein